MASQGNLELSFVFTGEERKKAKIPTTVLMTGRLNKNCVA